MSGVSYHRKVRLELSPCVHRQLKKEKASGIELRSNKGSCLKGRGKKGIGYLKIYFNLTLPFRLSDCLVRARQEFTKEQTQEKEQLFFYPCFDVKSPSPLS